MTSKAAEKRKNHLRAERESIRRLRLYQAYLFLGSGSGIWSWAVCAWMEEAPQKGPGGSPSPAHGSSMESQDTQDQTRGLIGAF